MDFVIHNHVIDRLAFFNGIISGFALYPQVYSVAMSGSIEGVSIITFLMIFINSVVWFVYSIHRGLISLGIASTLNCVASGILVLLIMFFS